MELYILDIEESADDMTEVFAVGLVERPAIERNWMKFAAQSEQKFSVSDEDKMILAGPLMVADQPIYRRDGAHEYQVAFPAKTIEKIVTKYARSGKTLAFNINHDDGQMVQGAFLQQHFIIDSTKGINTPEGFQTLPDGSWFGFVKIDDRKVWDEQVKTDKLKGFSVEGYFNDIKLTDAPADVYEELKNKLLNMKDISFEKLEKVIGKETYDKLRKFFNPEVKKFGSLADGTEFEGEVVEGGSILIGGQPAADGQYTTSDGVQFNVFEGKVTMVGAKPEDQMPEEMTAEKIQEMIQTALSEQKKAFDAEIEKITNAHAKQIEANSEMFAEVLKAVDLVAESKQEQPEKKSDPRDAARAKQQERFQKFNEIKNKYKQP